MDDIGRAKLQHNDHGYSLPTKEIEGMNESMIKWMKERQKTMKQTYAIGNAKQGGSRGKFENYLSVTASHCFLTKICKYTYLYEPMKQ